MCVKLSAYKSGTADSNRVNLAREVVGKTDTALAAWMHVYNLIETELANDEARVKAVSASASATDPNTANAMNCQASGWEDAHLRLARFQVDQWKIRVVNAKEEVCVATDDINRAAQSLQAKQEWEEWFQQCSMRLGVLSGANSDVGVRESASTGLSASRDARQMSASLGVSDILDAINAIAAAAVGQGGMPETTKSASDNVVQSPPPQARQVTSMPKRAAQLGVDPNEYFWQDQEHTQLSNRSSMEKRGNLATVVGSRGLNNNNNYNSNNNASNNNNNKNNNSNNKGGLRQMSTNSLPSSPTYNNKVGDVMTISGLSGVSQRSYSVNTSVSPLKAKAPHRPETSLSIQQQSRQQQQQQQQQHKQSSFQLQRAQSLSTPDISTTATAASPSSSSPNSRMGALFGFRQNTQR